MRAAMPADAVRRENVPNLVTAGNSM